MRKLIFCLLPLAISNASYSVDDPLSDSVSFEKKTVNVSQPAWTCLNDSRSVFKALSSQEAVEGSAIVALDPLHFKHNQKQSWFPILSHLLSYDMLLDINTQSSPDSNGNQQVNNGVFLISKTSNSLSFFTDLLQKEKAKTLITDGHPTLFSSLISEYKKSKKITVAPMSISALPLIWSGDKISPVIPFYFNSLQLNKDGTAQELKMMESRRSSIVSDGAPSRKNSQEPGRNRTHSDASEGGDQIEGEGKEKPLVPVVNHGDDDEYLTSTYSSSSSSGVSVMLAPVMAKSKTLRLPPVISAGPGPWSFNVGGYVINISKLAPLPDPVLDLDLVQETVD